MDIVTLSAFALYLCVLMSIGLFFFHRTKNAKAFMLGDRSVNYWVTAIATQASDMGSWLFLGLPAAVYTGGLFHYWSAIGLVLGMFASWQWIAPRLRSQTEKYKCLTLTSYFTARYGDPFGLISITSSAMILSFFMYYIASGLVGLSLLFSTTFGISYELGISISLFVATAYTLIGGFVGVAWCDMFQGVFLLLMIMMVPSYALFSMGSIQPIIDTARASNISLSLFGSMNDTLYALALAAGWGLGYFGQPHILVNFMGIDNPQKITYAKRVGISWQILVLTSSTAIGLIGLGFFATPLANPELVFILMTKALFHPFIAGLVLCAILAATLSTLDSLILVAGSTFAQMSFRKRPNVHPSAMVFQSRLGSIIIALASLYLAWHTQLSVYNLVNYAWSGLGATFGPLVIASLYSDNVTAYGAFASMLTGAVAVMIWPYSLPLVPGFFASTCALVIISAITQKNR